MSSNIMMRKRDRGHRNNRYLNPYALLLMGAAPDVSLGGCAAAASFHALGSNTAASKTVAVTGEINLR